MTWAILSREPARSRFLVVVGVIGLAALVSSDIWAAGRDRLLLAVVVHLVVLGAFIVAAVVYLFTSDLRSRRAQPSTRLVLVRGGFALLPTVPIGVAAALSTAVLGMQVGVVVNAWHTVGRGEPTVVTDIAFAATFSVLVLVQAAIVAVILPVAWHAVTVELTPAGIWSRAAGHTRLIPWPALAPGSIYRDAKRVRLAVERPELVEERGWHAFLGTRQRPTLPVDADAWVVAEAVGWYVEHPADRAAIGSPAELKRLLASLPSAPPSPSAPPPPPPTPSAETQVGARRIRTVGTLVYVASAIALFSAAAELAITIVFRGELFAAERATAALTEPLDGTVILNTDTVGFAAGTARVALVGTLLVAAAAVALVRRVAAGSEPSRVGLIVLAGIGSVVACCSIASPVASLGAVPAAGTLLNAWSGIRFPEGLAVAALALVVLALLVTPDVASYTRSGGARQ